MKRASYRDGVLWIAQHDHRGYSSPALLATLFGVSDDTVANDILVARLNETRTMSVLLLELSVRAFNCLENANINYVGELVTKTEAEMLEIKNFGRKTLNEVKDILSEKGLSLGMKLPKNKED